MRGIVFCALLLTGCASTQTAQTGPADSAALFCPLPTQTDQTQDRGFSLSAIRFYQKVIGPQLGQKCNFHPSCSRYSAEAVRTYGPVKGVFMTADRLTRCHYCAMPYYPWADGKLQDPVSENVIPQTAALQ